MKKGVQIMRNGIYYKCDDCGETAQFSSYKKARKKGGWAVNKLYKKCWCPKCAPAHRNGGATKANDKQLLPDGWEQLKIVNL